MVNENANTIIADHVPVDTINFSSAAAQISTAKMGLRRRVRAFKEVRDGHLDLRHSIEVKDEHGGALMMAARHQASGCPLCYCRAMSWTEQSLRRMVQ